MVKPPEHRHVARFPVPVPVSRLGLGPEQVRLCDLSPKGARNAQVRPLPDNGTPSRSQCPSPLAEPLGRSLQGPVSAAPPPALSRTCKLEGSPRA